MKNFAFASILAAASFAAVAQPYVEVGYSAVTLKASDNGDSIKAHPNMLGVTVGYDVHPNVAVEGMFAFGVRDSSIELNGATVPVDVKINNSYGVFVKPKVKLGESFEVFGRLGYAKTKLTVSGGGLSESESDGEFAYGVGANYYVNKNVYITGNFMNFYNKDDTKVNAFTVGVGYRF